MDPQLSEDLAAQPELLAAAEAKQAEKIGAGTSGARPAAEKAGQRRPDKQPKKRASIFDLPAFQDLGGGKSGETTFKKAKRRIEAIIKLPRHQSGAKKGQLTGRVMYALNCAYEDNAAFQALCKRIVHNDPRWIPDFLKFCANCPTAAIALKLHNAVLTDASMAETASEVNKHLDVKPYDDPAIETPAFTLATSETQFETARDGVLPRSIMVMGPRTYEFKEFMKAHFPEIRYLDLVFNNGTVKKAAWVLPAAAETERTGTLADFLRGLGAVVTEVDLDEGDDEDDDAEPDNDGFIDGEAEEDDGEEGEEGDDDA